MDTTNPQAAVTVNHILDLYAEKCVPELAPRTQKDYVRHLVKLRRVYGSAIAKDLLPKNFGPFLDVKKGKIQRVRQLAVLSAAFTQAVSTWYIIDRNVLRDVKRPKSKPRDRLILDDEFDAVKALAPLRVKLAMQLAVITGQRQGDILSFRWSDIEDLPVPVVDPITKETITSELNVYQSKTGKRIGIGITKDLDAVLDRCWLLPMRGEFILTRRYGGRYTGEGFRAMWQRSMRKFVRLGGLRFTFHDIRALCATKQPTVEHARMLLGHSNISMTARIYRRGKERVTPCAMPASMAA